MRPSIRCSVLSMILVTFIFCAIGKSQDSNLTQAFDISELNTRLRNEAGLSQSQCREWLESRVRPLIAFKGPQLAYQSRIEIEGVKVVSDSTRRGVVAIDDKLHVVAPKEEQTKVQELIDTFTRFGVRQIEIRTHVYRDTSEAMKTMPIQWSHVEAASSIAESPGSTAVRPASHALPLTVAAKFIESQKPEVKEDLPPPEGVTEATWTEATSIVERSHAGAL